MKIVAVIPFQYMNREEQIPSKTISMTNLLQFQCMGSGTVTAVYNRIIILIIIQSTISILKKNLDRIENINFDDFEYQSSAKAVQLLLYIYIYIILEKRDNYEYN